ncbi:MAG TPA: hypothetical protein VHQ64_10585 [Pyrinomonadaceae bacterium]|jgi:uncharacterized membrane protein (UPF0136 family)|nr:hypothetical protein [Pyrinomonadaceae bacterium]
MNNQEDRSRKAMKKAVPHYARLFFDHLFSEYIELRPAITDPDILKRLDDIHEKRVQHELTWSDIYTFDLTLVDFRPPESLVRKAYDSRSKYRSVAGQKEYDEYIASKPIDLGSIQIDPDAQPPKPSEILERELRADIKYLLSKFYLYYALLPAREGLRDELTKRAALVTGLVVALIALAIVINVGGIKFLPSVATYTPVVITVLTVVLAGVVGGCVSMLQRIQSAPTEGDALFNLASLTNGWRGILLSPIYGGIFASLLFILFAAGILNGSVFPTIITPSRTRVQAAAAASPSPTATPAPGPSASPAGSVSSSESPQSDSTKSASNAAVHPTPEIRRMGGIATSPSPTPSASPTPESPVLQIKTFLSETGPASGVAYALLIIWSFLAGFAERLVPDTLNRLVQKNIDIQGK